MKSQIANIITGFRALSTPLIFTFIASSGVNYAIIIYIVALVSDVLDGFVARKLSITSEFGALFDACADFLLVTTGVLGCIILNLTDFWVLGVIWLMFGQFILGYGKRVVYDPSGKAFGVFSILSVHVILIGPPFAVALIEYIILFLACGSFISRQLYLRQSPLSDQRGVNPQHVPSLNMR